MSVQHPLTILFVAGAPLVAYPFFRKASRILLRHVQVILSILQDLGDAMHLHMVPNPHHGLVVQGIGIG